MKSVHVVEMEAEILTVSTHAGSDTSMVQRRPYVRFTLLA